MSTSSEEDDRNDKRAKPLRKFYAGKAIVQGAESAKLRGTGRTRAQLEKVPDGGIFLVHCASMKMHAVSELQKLGRDIQKVKVLIIHDMYSLQMLRGLSAPIYVDHWLWDHGTPEFRVAIQSVRNFAGGNP